MPRIASILFVVLGLMLSSCSDDARSSYLALSGRVFIFNVREATATYVVTFNVLKPLPVGSKLVALFDDPAGGERLRMEQISRSGQSKVTFESEPLNCIKVGKPYQFEVELKDNAGAVLQRVESSITSTLDQSVLPPVPLVIGPGYEPNPAAKSVEAGKILRERAIACPP
jgi:hypothetical protein